MATKDTNRVTKDTSARKTSNVYSGVEVKAKEQYYETVIKGLREKYQTQCEEMEAAEAKLQQNFEAQMEEQKDTHKADIIALKAQCEAAVNKAHEDNVAKTTQLDSSVTEWERKYKAMQKMFTDDLDKKKREIAAAKAESARALAEMERARTAKNQELDAVRKDSMRAIERAKATEQAKTKEIEALKGKLAIEVTFRRRGFKDRTYIRRPGTKFSDVLEQLRNDTSKPVLNLQFVCQGHRTDRNHHSRALQELGIEDGSVINY